MISGEIPAPAISLGNRDVILRHLAAIAFGAADPGLAGRMVEYVSEQGDIKTEPMNALIAAVQAQTGHALQMARQAWGDTILNECGLNEHALQAHLAEGLEPSEAERQAGLILNDEGRGFCLCSTCGRQLAVPRPDNATGPRRRARAGNPRDPFGHAPSCAHSGQPPQPAGIVTSIAAEVLRLVAFIPEGFDREGLDEWSHSLGAALRIGIGQHLLLDGSEIDFEPEGPWQESHDAGSFQRVSLTFVNPSVGGSGYIARIGREFHLVAQRALQHLNHPNCETACYRCLKSYRNQRHHNKLRWPAIIGDLEQLAETTPQPVPLEQGDTHDPGPWLEAFAAGVGSPLELRFLRLFEQHGFNPERQVPVAPADGAPPISIADFAVPSRSLAIYVDGAAFHIGARLRRDRIIRNRLREGPRHWTIVELRAADLARGAALVQELANR